MNLTSTKLRYFIFSIFFYCLFFTSKAYSVYFTQSDLKKLAQSLGYLQEKITTERVFEQYATHPLVPSFIIQAKEKAIALPNDRYSFQHVGIREIVVCLKQINIANTLFQLPIAFQKELLPIRQFLTFYAQSARYAYEMKSHCSWDQYIEQYSNAHGASLHPPELEFLNAHADVKPDDLRTILPEDQVEPIYFDDEFRQLEAFRKILKRRPHLRVSFRQILLSLSNASLQPKSSHEFLKALKDQILALPTNFSTSIRYSKDDFGDILFILSKNNLEDRAVDLKNLIIQYVMNVLPEDDAPESLFSLQKFIINKIRELLIEDEIINLSDETRLNSQKRFFLAIRTILKHLKTLTRESLSHYLLFPAQTTFPHLTFLEQRLLNQTYLCGLRLRHFSENEFKQWSHSILQLQISFSEIHSQKSRDYFAVQAQVNELPTEALWREARSLLEIEHSSREDYRLSLQALFNYLESKEQFSILSYADQDWMVSQGKSLKGRYRISFENIYLKARLLKINPEPKRYRHFKEHIDLLLARSHPRSERKSDR